MDWRIVTPKGEYISTRCYLDEHEDCQRHPIVRCACMCHRIEGDDRSSPPEGFAAGPGWPVTGNQQ